MLFLNNGVNLSLLNKYNNFNFLRLIMATWPLTSNTTQLRIYFFVYFIFLN